MQVLRVIDVGAGVFLCAAGVDMTRQLKFESMVVGIVVLLLGIAMVIESLVRVPGFSSYFKFLQRFWGRGITFVLCVRAMIDARRLVRC